ncbi:MAG: hypothetical protein J6C00_13215 [Eubacterium sp.]|nr:hypothetical protein [Eubacterium sp.]
MNYQCSNEFILALRDLAQNCIRKVLLMNDRYLFRANRTDNGEWVSGYYTYYPEGMSGTEDTKHTIRDTSTKPGRIYFVDPTTICQCTGLEDKNGKLIWENDIVMFQFDNDDCPFPNKDTKKRVGKVFFSDFRASWSIAMGKKGSKGINNDLFKFVQNGNRVEVIGSAFDNPELLDAWKEAGEQGDQDLLMPAT